MEPEVDAPGVSLRKRIRLGIDGSRLLHAKYGKGRYLGAFLMDLAKHPALQTHLIGAGDLTDIFRKRFRNTPVVIADAADVHDDALDVVWYPWGEMPFTTDAAEILTLHDLGAVSSPPKGWWRASRARAALFAAVRSAERIVTFSSWSAQKIARGLDILADDIAIVPPLPDGAFSPGPQELKYEHLADMPFVLCVAGWKKHHDVRLVIDAFRKAVRKTEIQLVIVGPLDEKARKALDRVPHHVHIDQQLDDGALRSLYRNAAAVAHPATKSHWSHTAAEALACGAPLLTSTTGSTGQIAHDQGLLLPPSDRRAWQDALEDVLFDDITAHELRTAASNGWGALSRRTSVDAMVAVIQKLVP